MSASRSKRLNWNRHPGLDPGPALSSVCAMDRIPCVYLLAKASHSTFYTGVTSNLPGRMWEHRTEMRKGFTARYGIKRLVWYEVHETMEAAIHREKQIKRWARTWKYDLVNAINPGWRDLAEDFGFDPMSLGRQAGPGSSPG